MRNSFRGNIFITVGPSGVDVSKDNGRNWMIENRKINNLTAIAFAKNSNTGFAVGKSGNVKIPQLHFEIRKGKEAVDPLKYLS